MMLHVRDCDNNELFAAEVLDYAGQENNIWNVIIPFGEYPQAGNILTTDLLVIRLTTNTINYEGHGRIFEVFPDAEGSLLRIRFDGAYDVH